MSIGISYFLQATETPEYDDGNISCFILGQLSSSKENSGIYSILALVLKHTAGLTQKFLDRFLQKPKLRKSTTEYSPKGIFYFG
ncbi:unnamed protein product [Caretta caretta]